MLISAHLLDHAAIAEAVMEGFVLAAMVEIESGLVPPFPHDAGVRYQQEPPGHEDWDLPHVVARRGWGDCEDLSFWHCAGLRVTGEDEGARCIVVKTGVGKLHAIVERSDGSHDDPSLDLYQGSK